MTQSSMIFLTTEEFKATVNTTKIEFAKGEKDGKPTKFAISGGKTFKAQLAIDYSKPIRFMYNAAEGFDNGCFTNVKPIEVEFSC